MHSKTMKFTIAAAQRSADASLSKTLLGHIFYFVPRSLKTIARQSRGNSDLPKKSKPLVFSSMNTNDTVYDKKGNGFSNARMASTSFLFMPMSTASKDLLNQRQEDKKISENI